MANFRAERPRKPTCEKCQAEPSRSMVKRMFCCFPSSQRAGSSSSAASAVDFQSRPPLKSYDSVLVVDGLSRKQETRGVRNAVRSLVRRASVSVGFRRSLGGSAAGGGPLIISGSAGRLKKGKAIGDGESGIMLDDRDFDNGFAVGSAVLKKRADFVRILPAEITGLIFSFVDHKALVNCERVSQAWRNAALDNHLWRQVFQKEHGPWQAAPGKDWKAMFAVNKDLRNKWKRAEMTYKYMDGHSDSVYCVQFDDVKAITGSRDRSLRVWDITTGECLQTIEAASGTTFYPSDSNIPIPSNLRHDGSILCLQYDPEILITGSSDGSCIVWSLPTFTTIARLSSHSAGVLDLCFDHSHIITCSRDMTVCVWDRSTFKLLRQLRGHTGPVNAIALRENMIVSASGDSLVKMWDIKSGECIRDFKGHQRGLACVQFSEDMTTIVSGGNDMDIRVWDAHTGECRNILEGHRNLVRTLHLDARNRRIVSGSYDATVKVWSLDTGKLALDIKHFHSTWVLAVKSDHKRLISTSQDKLGLVIDFSEGVKGLEMLDEE